MDVTLNQLQSECPPTDFENAVKLLFIYIKNINQNSAVEKYRKIRIGNEKFHSNVWRHETCRTLLLLAGFEQVGDFLILPKSVDVSVLYDLLLNQMTSIDPNFQNNSADKQPPQKRKNTSLNLVGAAQGGGLFGADTKADLTLLSYMVEMGYSKHAAEKGLIASKNQGVQPAIDWIATHPECNIVDVEPTVSTTYESPSAAPQASEIAPTLPSRLRNANEQKFIYQEKLRLEAIKKAKLEKAEDQIAKKNLMKNMQSERLESKEKFEREKIIRHVEVGDPEKTLKSSSPTTHDVNMCTLRIRMPDGQTLMWETDKTTSIESLYGHVTSLMVDVKEEFHVCIPHPHELLDADDKSSLQDKGLYPKATVVVQKVKQPIIAGAEDVSVPAGESSNTDDSLSGTETVVTGVQTVGIETRNPDDSLPGTETVVTGVQTVGIEARDTGNSLYGTENVVTGAQTVGTETQVSSVQLIDCKEDEGQPLGDT